MTIAATATLVTHPLTSPKYGKRPALPRRWPTSIPPLKPNRVFAQRAICPQTFVTGHLVTGVLRNSNTLNTPNTQPLSNQSSPELIPDHGQVLTSKVPEGRSNGVPIPFSSKGKLVFW
jgi:hypothetical protein